MRLKKKSDFLIMLLGIPNLNKTNHEFYIPKNGYDSFFKYLKKSLENKKIKIELLTKVSIKEKYNKKHHSKKEIKAYYFNGPLTQ